MPLLENTARIDASFAGAETFDISTALVDVPGVNISKVANMTVWRGDDPLQYTITVENIDTVITAEDITVTDTINIAIAELDVDSVRLDGTPLTQPDDFEYNDTTGLLEIHAITSMAPGATHEITFLVTKA